MKMYDKWWHSNGAFSQVTENFTILFKRPALCILLKPRTSLSSERFLLNVGEEKKPSYKQHIKEKN